MRSSDSRSASTAHDEMAHRNAATTRHDVDEAWNKGNVDVYEESLAPDCIAHNPALPSDIQGRESLKQMVLAFRSALPDLHVTLDDIVADDDKVVTRWTATGTHQGWLLGLEPSHRTLIITGITIDRFADGQIVESWTYWDDSALRAIGWKGVGDDRYAGAGETSRG